MRVLVTGGGGFIGRALTPLLIKAGHGVIVTSRNANTTVPGATVRQVGELGPDTRWDEALEGVDAVVHLAARVHIMNERAADPLEENRRVNTQGTANLATSAARAGVKRLVFLSTIKVNGEATRDEPFHATDTPAPQDAYAVAKLEAEQTLMETAAKEGPSIAIIRPPLVYGPGVRGNFLALLNIAGGYRLSVACSRTDCRVHRVHLSVVPPSFHWTGGRHPCRGDLLHTVFHWQPYLLHLRIFARIVVALGTSAHGSFTNSTSRVRCGYWWCLRS